MEQQNTEKKTVVAWIPRYMPFIMGGDVHKPACAELEVAEETPVGRSYTVFRVVAPNGTDFYVEALSGAILGSDLQMIKDDIEQGDQEYMERQIATSIQQRNKAQQLEPELFWSYVKGSGAKRKVI